MPVARRRSPWRAQALATSLPAQSLPIVIQRAPHGPSHGTEAEVARPGYSCSESVHSPGSKLESLIENTEVTGTDPTWSSVARLVPWYLAVAPPTTSTPSKGWYCSPIDSTPDSTASGSGSWICRALLGLLGLCAADSWDRLAIA